MIKSSSAPLIVDWQPEYRADLEVAIKRGLAVVRFDQNTFELLPRCHAKADYNYVGVTPKEQHITLRSHAELQANLPFGAVQLGGKLGKEGALVVALRMVGKEVLDLPSVNRAQLQGDCATATHYISALTLGAFKFAATANAEAAAKVDVFGRGASGEAAGSTEMLQSDGNFTSCDSANPDAANPPSHCGAVLRIQIVPLDAAETIAMAAPPQCGEGLRWNGQMCVTEKRAEAESHDASNAPANTSSDGAFAGASPRGYVCDTQKPAECVAQCRIGNHASCNALGYFLKTGAGGMPQDTRRAAALWGVSCEAGYGEACTSLAGLLEEQRLFDHAAKIATKGCLAGDPHACNEIAVLAFYGRGVPKNRPAAFNLWMRGCKLRDWTSCNNAGVMIMHGMDGAPRDAVGARKLFASACAAPGKDGCSNLASCFEHGLGGEQDTARAVQLNVEACEAGQASACAAAGLLIEAGGGASDKRRALALYEQGCGMSVGGGCLSAQELRQYFPGAYTDEGYDRRACEEGDQRALACYNAAIASERGYSGSVDVAKAQEYLDVACKSGGMKKACRAARP